MLLTSEDNYSWGYLRESVIRTCPLIGKRMESVPEVYADDFYLLLHSVNL